MPYATRADLPERIKNNLPAHAQDIYREAFNHAWDEYQDPSKRYTEESREAVAHKVAWSAVEKKYGKKQDGSWAEK